MTDIVFYGHMTCQCLAGIQSVLVFSFRRLKLHRGSKADQYKKKIAKLETDLRVLQEGRSLEARYGGYGGGLRGRIEGSIRGMSL